MKMELEEEIKARINLESIKFKMDSEYEELKKRLNDLNQISESFDEETKARDSWKKQLEMEFEELKNQEKTDFDTKELLEELKKRIR